MENKLCSICPRKCNIDRNKQTGFCGQTNDIYISKVMLHHFEEPCISGCETLSGSGAIFFSGCNLKCIYCQNHDISQSKSGKCVTIDGLINIFKQLEDAGAYNINLVTPTHYSNQIIEALKKYKPNIPVVWNSSGYEKLETLKRLENLIDIFLLDFKYMDENLAFELSQAKDYPSVAKTAILEAKRQQPINIFNDNGLMKSGLIVRHMCLPTYTEDSKKIISWIHDNIGSNTIISIMSQYVPMHKAVSHATINRKLKPIEYKIVINHAKKIGMNNAYIQDLSSSNTSFTPNFAENNTDFEY